MGAVADKGIPDTGADRDLVDSGADNVLMDAFADENLPDTGADMDLVDAGADKGLVNAGAGKDLRVRILLFYLHTTVVMRSSQTLRVYSIRFVVIFVITHRQI